MTSSHKLRRYRNLKRLCREAIGRCPRPSKVFIKVLGVPVGHPSFIAAQMTSKLKEQAVLFERIPLIDDVQVGWLLLVFCAATRANYWLRTVPPECTEEYAMGHDRNVLQCLSSILQVEELPSHSHEVASLPLTLGGLGVGGSSKIRHTAHWSSWADCLEMIKQRHPGSAEDIIHGMAVGSGHMKVVEESGTRLREMGVSTPPWEALAEGLRPQPSDSESWMAEIRSRSTNTTETMFSGHGCLQTSVLL